MKKTALFILMLCMGSALTLKAQNTDVSGMDNVIYIEPFTVEPGTTEVTLQFKMKNTAEIRGFQFSLFLPEGVTIKKASTGKITGSKLNSDRLPEYVDEEEDIEYEPHTLKMSEQNGVINYLCDQFDGLTFTGNEGVLLTSKIILPADLPVGDYEIVMKDVKLAGPDGERVTETIKEIKTTMTIGTATAIKSVSTKKVVNGTYNVAGQQVEMQKGINIVDGKKVMVK